MKSLNLLHGKVLKDRYSKSPIVLRLVSKNEATGTQTQSIIYSVTNVSKYLNSFIQMMAEV